MNVSSAFIGAYRRFPWAISLPQEQCLSHHPLTWNVVACFQCIAHCVGDRLSWFAGHRLAACVQHVTNHGTFCSFDFVRIFTIVADPCFEPVYAIDCNTCALHGDPSMFSFQDVEYVFIMSIDLDVNSSKFPHGVCGAGPHPEPIHIGGSAGAAAAFAAAFAAVAPVPVASSPVADAMAANDLMLVR